jgi:hypothetical protein
MKTHRQSTNHKPRNGSSASWVKQFWAQSFRDRIGMLLCVKSDANYGLGLG